MSTTGTTELARLLAHAVEVLQAADVPDAAVDARWLVEAATGHDPRAGTRVDLPLHADAADSLATMLARRAAREPLQLIVGTTAFRDLTLTCTPGVFIPRPETEVLAGLAIDLAATSLAARGRAVVVEPCCGTGAVALALASELAGAEVHAADLDPAAVALAHANRDRLMGEGRLRSPVSVSQGDLLTAFDPTLRGRIDVLVANPPYLPDSDLPGLPPEVARHDPPAALFGGPDGHEVVRALLTAAPTWLAPGGHVLLELDARRADTAIPDATVAGLTDARIVADLTGAPRFLVARG